MRLYGKFVAIQTAGPDAVEPEARERALGQAADMISRNFLDTKTALSVVGVELDMDTYDLSFEEDEEQTVLGWKCEGRQKRGLVARLIWAARL